MRIAPTIALLLLAALMVAGCGAVDDAKDKVVKQGRGEIHRQCIKRAQEIKDPEDRRSALRACHAVNGGGVDSVRAEVARRCMKAAAKASDPDLRRKARERCLEIRNGK